MAEIEIVQRLASSISQICDILQNIINRESYLFGITIFNTVAILGLALYLFKRDK